MPSPAHPDGVTHPDGLTLPAGSSLDLDSIRDVVSVSNFAHHALGTRLLGIERHAVLLGIDEPPSAVAASVMLDHWPNGIITSLLDHGCALAALLALDDPARFGGSLGIHVEYLRPSDARLPLHVRAECHNTTAFVAQMRATAFHPDSPHSVVATASATVAVIEPTVGLA